MGSENMFNATKNVVTNMSNSDTIINVVICGGDKKFAIGELIDAREENLTCVESEIS
mgnify:FL=1